MKGSRERPKMEKKEKGALSTGKKIGGNKARKHPNQETPKPDLSTNQGKKSQTRRESEDQTTERESFLPWNRNWGGKKGSGRINPTLKSCILGKTKSSGVGTDSRYRSGGKGWEKNTFNQKGGAKKRGGVGRKK